MLSNFQTLQTDLYMCVLQEAHHLCLEGVDILCRRAEACDASENAHLDYLDWKWRQQFS